ncbi:MAG: CC0125/CC1285 family lipoprotein [Caulobacterales bacterium]
MKPSTIALAATLLLACGLAGCETATPYQPDVRGNSVSGGFTDQQVEPNRYRITFQGNSMTSRETVETYLLYRAAELTLAQGDDWFEMADRHTDRDRRTYLDPDPFYGPGYAWGYWRPVWRFHHFRGGGWGVWDPFWGDPFWADGVDVQEIDRYQATAEIVMQKGAKPADDPKAFDAHAVMTSLAPKIVRPK